jgi:cell division protein FtsW
MAAVELPSVRSRTSQNVRVPRATPSERKPERKENLRKSYGPQAKPDKHAKPELSREPAPSMLASGPADSILMATVIALIAFGIVMVYSASSVWAHLHYNDDQLLLVRQARHAAIGLALMLALSRLDYHRLRAFTYPFMLGSLLLLAATALGFGHAAGGAARWIKVGPIGVQPAEITKLAFICWLAYSLSNKTARIRSFSVGFLPHLLGAGLVMVLCLKQPDFGSAVMIGLILFCLLFTAGARLGYLLGAGLLSLPLVYGAVASSEYRLRRIMSFLSNSENYQIRESWMSFGAGGVTGVGIGDSHQKLLFLPEAHTDFISAIVGEELGLVGFTIMVLAFLLVVYRGIRAAFRAVDEYGTYLAVGITLFLGTQAFTNLAVAVGLVPTKGLVLPFISYGGSSLLVNCCCVGILLNVSRPRSLSSCQLPLGGVA